MTPVLRLLPDMNLSPLAVDDLRREGWDRVRVSSVLPAISPDAETLALAREQDRVAITQELDFSTLLALGGFTRPSAITLRVGNTDPAIVTARLRIVMAQIAQALDKGSAVTVHDTSVRIRRLPIR